jgi:hypothetical protein
VHPINHFLFPIHHYYQHTPKSFSLTPANVLLNQSSAAAGELPTVEAAVVAMLQHLFLHAKDTVILYLIVTTVCV